MTIRAGYNSSVIVTETITTPYVSPGNPSVGFAISESDTLTASTDVPATKCAFFQKAMVSGTGTIDLTSLPGLTSEEIVNGTNLKVQILKLRSLATNANLLTVTKGGSNGYGLGAWGATWTIPLSPGQSVLILGDETNPDIGSGARTIDLAGTLAQVLEVGVVMG